MLFMKVMLGDIYKEKDNRTDIMISAETTIQHASKIMDPIDCDHEPSSYPSTL